MQEVREILHQVVAQGETEVLEAPVGNQEMQGVLVAMVM